jgi:hypothetical protein
LYRFEARSDGDLTEEYIWFLIPIYSTYPSEPGNAIAMESTAGEGKGRATYFFRILSRAEYSCFEKLEDLDKAADSSLATINKCMIAVNFRREPIYISRTRDWQSRNTRDTCSRSAGFPSSDCCGTSTLDE